MRILTIESTCDETAAAVVEEGPQVLGSSVASQDELHRRFKGVVPEVAARAHVERILPVISEAMQRAECQPQQLDAVAVASQPGLAGSLLVGLTAAKTLAVAWRKPLVAVNHLHAHIYACQLDRADGIYPCVGLIVSGGHTSLYEYRSSIDPRYLGGTIDDAAGESFDKVATMLGLPYPGGPQISKAAVDGDPTAYQFPRSMIDDDNLDFSFSGLKTAVRYALVGPGKQDFSQLNLDRQTVANVAASFQQAVVDTIVAKSRRAIRQSGHNRLCVGGGVAANGVLRDALQAAAQADGFELVVAPLRYCTDNAAMAALAIDLFKAKRFAPLDLDITPGLQRGH